MIITKHILTNAFKDTKFSNLFLQNVSRAYSNVSCKLGEVMKTWENILTENEVPEAKRSVELIVSHVLNCEPSPLMLSLARDRILSNKEMEDIERCCDCRITRMPIQYILQEWDFRHVKLKMVPPIFIPRPETEMLIDIIRENEKRIHKVLEIGCGTGAISIALLNEIPELQRVIAIDQNKLAHTLAIENAKLNGVGEKIRILHKKLSEDGVIEGILSDTFCNLDVIVSNPPYVFTSEIATLEPEIRLYEDIIALNGGKDGLKVIKAILKFASKHLGLNKSCFLEIHHKHVPMIKDWLNEHKELQLTLIKSFTDFQGFDRFVYIRKILQ